MARFVADAANNAADLDLYVYRLNAAGTALEALAGQSATGSADEMVTLTQPDATARYLVVVEGYAAAPGETAIATTYDEYLVGPTGLGSFHAEPDPVPVTQGQDHVVRRGLDRPARPVATSGSWSTTAPCRRRTSTVSVP